MRHRDFLVVFGLLACQRIEGEAGSGTPAETPEATTWATFDPLPTTGDGGTSGATAEVDTTTASPWPETGAGWSSRPDIGGDSACWTKLSKECDPYAQDCCPAQKCVPYAETGDGSWDALTCAPLAEETVPPGSPCTAEPGLTGVDDCELGSICWSVDEETSQGVCVAQCTGTAQAPHCDDPSTLCAITNDGVLAVCLPRCDPLAIDCPPGDLCVHIPGPAGGFVCTLDGSGDGGAVFEDCHYLNSCDHGPGEAPAGREDIGVCGVPQSP